MKISKRPPLDAETEVTCAQLARHFNLNEATIRRWRHDGMPAKKYNSRLYRYRLSEVEDWLEAREKERAAQSVEVAK